MISRSCLTMLERVAQQVALHAGEFARPDQAAGRRLGELGVEAQRHEKAQRLGQLAREMRRQRAELGQPRDARGGAGFEQAMFDRQRAHAVHDREDAALLQIERVALAFRGDEVVEQADRRREGVGRAGEMREIGALAAHRLDQLQLGSAQAARRRPRPPRRRRRSRRSCARARRAWRASGESRRDSRRSSSTTAD